MRRYYEDGIDDPENPLLHTLAYQIAGAVRRAGISNILCQNPNPTVSLLKAEEFGDLDPITAGTLTVTAVIHDTSGYEGRLSYIRKALARSRMRLQIIAVSDQVADALRRLGFQDVTVVANGLDIKGFQASLKVTRSDAAIFDRVRARNQLPVGTPLVLVAARRAPHKGHVDVIEACRRLNSRGVSDFVVAFTGATNAPEFIGHERFLAAEIRRLGLQRQIFMLDHLTDLEMTALYDRADVAILASTEPEGFAYANIEAMLARTAVITTRLGGPLGYIDHRETGWLVDPGDPQGIADALIKALDNRSQLARRIRRQALKRARQFTIDAMVKGYRSVLHANKPMLSYRVDVTRPFALVGEGTNAFTLARNDRVVVQTFKPNHLTVGQLAAEYRYLCEAYRTMPGLIPRQRFARRPPSDVLTDMLLIKERVHVDRSRLPLHLVEGPDPSLCRQMHQFLDVTRHLFTNRVGDDGSVHYCIPDIIDPRFRNLVVDVGGALRLVDTNWLMFVGSLDDMVVQGDKLDVNQRPKIAMLLRRLMFLENRFRQRSTWALRTDPFFVRYLSPEGFDQLFVQSELDGEAFL